MSLVKDELVWVKWVASTSPRGEAWHDQASVSNVVPDIMSIGYVHAVSRQAVTLVASWGCHPDDTYVGGVITIPRRAIVKSGKLEMSGLEVTSPAKATTFNNQSPTSRRSQKKI